MPAIPCTYERRLNIVHSQPTRRGWRTAVLLLSCLELALPCLGDTLWPLDESRPALEARNRVILGARDSLDFAMYWWKGDQTGAEAAALLQHAARRGTRVRIILDAIRSELPDSILRALCDTPGIRVRLFNPFNAHQPGAYNHRLHEKMIVADRKVMLIGGRNQLDKFYEHRDGRPYLDRDLLIEGSLAAAAGDYFDRLWCSPLLRDVAVSSLRQPASLRGPFLRTRSAQRRQGQQAMDAVLASALRPGTCQWPEPFHVPESRLALFTDRIEERKTSSPWLGNLTGILDGARREIWIETPWIVLTGSVRAALQRAADRGIAIHVITNSLPACRDYMVFAAHELSCHELTRMGARVWLMPGPASLHSKTIVVDRTVAEVGTFNLDPRSEFINRETMVHVVDRDFAGHVVGVMEEHRRQAHPFDHCAGRCLERSNRTPMNILKRAGVPLMRLFLPLYRATL